MNDISIKPVSKKKKKLYMSSCIKSSFQNYSRMERCFELITLKWVSKFLTSLK